MYEDCIENINFLVKTAVATFWATFEELGLLFYFCIWSHWPALVM